MKEATVTILANQIYSMVYIQYSQELTGKLGQVGDIFLYTSEIFQWISGFL